MSAFSVLPTIDGFDVIDNATGHPVDHRETRQSANGVARSTAPATYRARVIGSSSSSIETQANARRSRAAHCARTVVFP